MLKNKIFISALAREHLKQSYKWYEKQQLSLGKEFRREIEDCFLKLIEGNVDYQLYDDPIRKVKLKRFPYHIYYKRIPEKIVVLAVFHNKMSPDNIKAALE